MTPTATPDGQIIGGLGGGGVAVGLGPADGWHPNSPLTANPPPPLGLGRGLMRRCTLPHRRALWAAASCVPVSDLKGLRVPQEEHCTLDSLR